MVNGSGENKKIINKNEWIWLLIVSIIIVAFANLPYLLGYMVSDDNYFFAGVTVAPEDNLSYIAKIRQGAMGNWLFRLSYSSNDQKGAPVFLFYLILGHISRIIHITPEAIYHLSRIFGGLFLLFNVYLFISDITGNVNKKRFIFILVALSSGLGWAVILMHGEFLPTDITVPESNTFFSIMDTAHFAWSQAILLMIWRDILGLLKQTRKLTNSVISLCIETILLIIIQPFMFVITFGTISIFLFWQYVKTKRYDHNRVLILLLIGVINIAIELITFYWVNHDPALKIWYSQNITLSPPIIYFILGYGINLIPLIYGIILVFQKGDTEKLLLCWLLCSVIGLYLPFNLQRRLSLGLHIPISMLAGIGFYQLIITKIKSLKFRRNLSSIYILLTIPTTVMLVIIFSSGALNHHPKLFLSKNEYAAIQRLVDMGEKDKVVLSSSDLGAFIPAYTDNFSVSGHAFETINFTQTDKNVKTFFSPNINSNDRQAMLENWRVKFIILGPRESIYGIKSLTRSDGVYQLDNFGDVTLYSVISTAK